MTQRAGPPTTHLPLLARLLAGGLELLLLLGDRRLGGLRLALAQLVQRALLRVELRLGGHVLLGLRLPRRQVVALLLGRLHAVELDGALLVEALHRLLLLVDRLLQPVRADDVLEVLEQAVLVRRRRLRLHHRDLLHLALQDQEAVVVEVDAALAEQLGHIGEVARLAVDHVLGRVVAASLARHLQAATRDHVVAAVLAVDDVLEVDGHARVLQRWVLLRGVDELG